MIRSWTFHLSLHCFKTNTYKKLFRMKDSRFSVKPPNTFINVSPKKFQRANADLTAVNQK